LSRSQDQDIASLVKEVQTGKLLLPELQRGYVWKASQVRDLFDSLYHQYPSGQLLVWETDDLPASHTVSVSGVIAESRRPQLLLDGQQRLTSLTAVITAQKLVVAGRVKPIEIVFNVFTEKFEVAGPQQRGQDGWIKLSKFFTEGALVAWDDLNLDRKSPGAQQAHDHLRLLENILTYKYRVNVLEQLDYVEVTDIFVRINSGGTKLFTSDLALAQVSSRWHGVTDELSQYLRDNNKEHSLKIDTGFLMRAILVLFTGQSRFALFFRGDRQDTTVTQLRVVWKRVKPALDHAIQFIVQNCNIDKLDLLPTSYVLIPLMVFFDRFGTDVSQDQERELQRWVYMALIWTRYSGALETALDQDISALLGREQPIQTMIQNIEAKVGRGRQVDERDLQEQRSNSPYMLMAYVLARRAKAQDWFSSIIIGGDQKLEYHHIFPKALLKQKYDLQKDSRTVDQVANLAFISARANSQISNQDPVEYLSKIAQERLVGQSVPLDSGLWTLEHFEVFLHQRRIALADGINQLLLSLTGESTLWIVSPSEALDTRVNAMERQLRDLIESRLDTAQGAFAWDRLVPQDIHESVRGRIEQYLKKNPFEQPRISTLSGKLEQCQFSDYSKIVNVNWDLFKDVFGSKQKFGASIDAVNEARNALKHGREFLRHERASAEGGLIWLEDCMRIAIMNSDEQDVDPIVN